MLDPFFVQLFFHNEYKRCFTLTLIVYIRPSILLTKTISNVDGK